MKSFEMIKGYLDVDDNTSIYYERIGKIEMPTILFNHGGPGIGFSLRDKELFDFETCNVIFYDQRGSKRSGVQSKSYSSTTQDLIKDIDIILDHFAIDKVFLVGGSWGSTLSLLYAIHNPDRIKGICLRALFLACKASRSYFEEGGTKDFFPQAWARFRRQFSDQDDKEIMHSYCREILKNNYRTEKLSLELKLYASRVYSPNEKIQTILYGLERQNYIAETKVFCHFTMNDFFIENNYIVNHLHRIEHIPIKIVHGKNDHVTKIDFARNVSQNFSNITLLETEEGHSPHTEQNRAALRNEIADLLCV